MNFRTVFGQSWLNFWDCVQTVQAEISRLFSGKFGFGFDPETDVFGFCGVFLYPNNSVTNREGTKRCPVLCGSKIWAILYVMVFMNNMQCVRIMLMHAN